MLVIWIIGYYKAPVGVRIFCSEMLSLSRNLQQHRKAEHIKYEQNERKGGEKNYHK